MTAFPRRISVTDFWSRGVARLTRCPVKAETAGSNPVDSVFSAEVAQLVEHTPEKRGVVSSILTLGIFFCRFSPA